MDLKESHLTWGRDSPIENTNKQIGSRIYIPRKTGRSGNELFEYFFWFQKAHKDKKKFKCYYGPLPGQFKHLPLEFRGHLKRFKIDNEIPDYPFDSKFYFPNRKELLKIVPKRDFKYDVTIHVRLGDITNDQVDYQPLSIEYYKEVLDSLLDVYGFDLSNCVIVGHPTNDKQFDFIKDLEKELNCRWLGLRSVSQDLETLGLAKHLIASTSTFWYWPWFFSGAYLIYPDYGICKKMNTKMFKNARACVPKFIEKSELE